MRSQLNTGEISHTGFIYILKSIVKMASISIKLFSFFKSTIF